MSSFMRSRHRASYRADVLNKFKMQQSWLSKLDNLIKLASDISNEFEGPVIPETEDGILKIAASKMGRDLDSMEQFLLLANLNKDYIKNGEDNKS